MNGYAKRLAALWHVMHIVVSEYGCGSKLKLLLAMALVVIQPRLPRAIRRAQRLSLQMEGKRFDLWMLDRTSIAAFEEVFIREEYRVPDISAPKVVVDAGANIGVTSVYFLLRYPEARVYAVEPNPDVCGTLRKNLAPYPRSSVHECALSDVNGTVDFYVHPTSNIASSIQKRVSGSRTLAVPSKTIEEFAKEQGIAEINIFKFDVEGAEYRLLHAAKNLRIARCYVGEIHEDLLDAPLKDIKALFAGFDVKTTPTGKYRSILTAVART